MLDMLIVGGGYVGLAVASRPSRPRPIWLSK